MDYKPEHTRESFTLKHLHGSGHHQEAADVLMDIALERDTGVKADYGKLIRVW